jgi:hypothetical protein
MEYLITDFVFQPQEAWFWILIPLILLGLGTTIVITALKGKNIAVLGMLGAGKTQFLANIRNVDYKKYEATLGPEGYDSFSTHLGNRKVTIKKGIDIPGGDDYVKDYYKYLINCSDIVFFLFDSFKYLNEEEYANNVRARLDFIHSKIGDKSIETVIFGTFADKFKDNDAVNDAYSKIKKSINGKTYSDLFKKNFLLLDMQNKEELMNLLNNKLFKS